MPGVTDNDYAQVVAELGSPVGSAPGLVAHVAGPVDGGFRIVSVWETQDDADRFEREQLASAVERAHGGDPRAAEVRAGFRTFAVTG